MPFTTADFVAPRTSMFVYLLAALLAVLPGRTLQAQETGSSQVDLQVVQFGAGYGVVGGVRPGEWCGIQLMVHDRTTTQRSLLIRLNIPDADGDTTQNLVLLPPNPDVKQKIWVYTRIPFLITGDPKFEIQAWEVPSGTADATLARPERLLSRITHILSQAGMVSPNVAMFGIVAKDNMGQLGLDRYHSVRLQNDDWSPQGHEVYATPAMFRPADFPDRWTGLSSFEFIVWSAYGAGNDPSDLSESQAEALRTWVKKGGHLIVVLPGAGQVWTNPGSNKLFDITPRVDVEREEAVNLAPLKNMLVRADNKSPMPTNAVMQTFAPIDGARPGEAMRILNTPATVENPDGKCVVVRRLVGSGAVTMVGLDLTSKGFTGIGGPDPDVFWHRILGRRSKLDSMAEINKKVQAQGAFFGGRSHKIFDRGISTAINKGQSAGVGVGLAFICYAAYWLVAGLGAWAFLRQRNISQHAWLAFVIATALFTGIAWGGAYMIRPSAVDGQHLTIIDHVYGQSSRARSYLTLLLPWYGSAKITVGGTESETRQSAIAPWDAPREESNSGGAFPDARGYGADARAAGSLTVPTRATVKQFQADWMGPQPEKWNMPVPMIDDGKGSVRAGGEITQSQREYDVIRDGKKTANKALLLTGTIAHQLPGTLKDVWIIWVQPMDRLRGAPVADLPAGQVRMTILSRPWAAGELIDLGSMSEMMVKESSSQFDKFVTAQSLLPENRIDDVANLNLPSRADSKFLMASSFIPALRPPDMTQARGGFAASPALARQRMLHGLDLARWFSQPCVIVMGILDDGRGESPLPFPISVDGSEPNATRNKLRGTTIVRWVYPLADQPPRFSGVNPTATPTDSPTDKDSGKEADPDAPF